MDNQLYEQYLAGYISNEILIQEGSSLRGWLNLAGKILKHSLSIEHDEFVKANPKKFGIKSKLLPKGDTWEAAKKLHQLAYEKGFYRVWVDPSKKVNTIYGPNMKSESVRNKLFDILMKTFKPEQLDDIKLRDSKTDKLFSFF